MPLEECDTHTHRKGNKILDIFWMYIDFSNTNIPWNGKKMDIAIMIGCLIYSLIFIVVRDVISQCRE